MVKKNVHPAASYLSLAQTSYNAHKGTRSFADLPPPQERSVFSTVRARGVWISCMHGDELVSRRLFRRSKPLARAHRHCGLLRCCINHVVVIDGPNCHSDSTGKGVGTQLLSDCNLMSSHLTHWPVVPSFTFLGRSIVDRH